MSENSFPDSTNAAIGGNVWRVPQRIKSTSPAIHPKKESKWAYAIPILLLAGIFGCCIMFALNANRSSEDKWGAAYEQEYGYSSAQYGDDHFEADVVTTAGEKKTVGYMEYNGYQVFYENQDQLIEKIGKIEAGTYPSELKE